MASPCSTPADTAAATAAAAQPAAELLDGASSRHHAYSRKQKSLGLLCSNFVSLYNRDDVESVGLDDAARRLGVERRRIYDIVNVLESVGILVRKAKNRYSWIGFSGVPVALQELKERALREMSGSAPHPEESSVANVSDDEDDEKMGDQDADCESEKLTPSATHSSDKPGLAGCRLRSDHRKEKSLGLLTQNFVKLFLTMEIDTVSLDEAARLLLGDGHDSANMRTKVRRLYDIANVLSSLNLIEKTQQMETRKPAFRWLGTAGKQKEECDATVAAPRPRKPSSNKRAFGTELTNMAIKRSKTDNDVMAKKAKHAQSSGDILKDCKLAVQKQLGQGNIGSFVYGPFHPAGVRKQELDDGAKAREREKERVQDWENLAASFRPQYQNQALSDLFAHYVEAWKSWYLEFTQGSSLMPQQLSKSVINQLL